MIYLVEDDKGIRDLMVYTLNASGLEAKGFTSADEFYTALKNNIPSLVLLDIMLPGEDGITILKKLRANKLTENIPVIMASAKGTEYDKVIGLDLGADDYLAKPFGMMEMVSRVKAVLRRSNINNKTAKSSVLSVGAVKIDLGRHEVSVNEEPIELTFKEFELLKLFMQNPSLVFSRENLLLSVWGDDFLGETRTVDVHIGTLRTKLKEAGDYIKTIRGVGYKFEIPKQYIKFFKLKF